MRLKRSGVSGRIIKGNGKRMQLGEEGGSGEKGKTIGRT